MKYALLIYGDEQAAAQATPEQNQAVADAYEVFTKSIVESGNFLDGDPFLPTATATTWWFATGDGDELRAGRDHRPSTPRVLQGPGRQRRAGGRDGLANPGSAVGLVEVRQIMQFD